MHVWFNGRTSAFQAENVGSIPITCSPKKGRKPSISKGCGLFSFKKFLNVFITFLRTFKNEYHTKYHTEICLKTGKRAAHDSGSFSEVKLN